MKKENDAPVSGYHKNCPSCGGLLRYDIQLKRLVCSSCQESHPLVMCEEPENTARDMDVLEYCCPQCGARLHTTNTNMVSYCNFCGADVMFTERMVRTRRPDRIIPFRITREECEEKYREYMGRQLKADQPLKFQPVYVPFYWYRETFEGEMMGQYVETDDSDSDYIVMTTYERPLDSRMHVEGEMECASSQFEPETADQLCLVVKEKEVKPFNMGYLYGFYAEAPDLASNLEEGNLDAFASVLAKDLAGKAVGKTITTLSLPPKTEDTAELILVPVWLLAKGNGRRVLYTAVSGVDGRVICDKPVSTKKVFFTAALLSVLVFALLFVFNSILVFQPNIMMGLCALVASAGYFCINSHLSRHNRHIRTHQKRKETKRCSVLGGTESSVCMPALTMGFNHALPLLIIGVTLLIFFAIFALQVTFLLPLMMVVLVGGLSITAQSIKNIFAMHRAMRDTGASVDRRGTLGEWLLLYGIWPAVIALVGLLIAAVSNNMNYAVGSLVSDRGWLAPMLCGYAALSLGIELYSSVLESRDRSLCMLEIVLLLAAVLLLLINPFKWVLHGMAVVLLIPVIVSMIRINRRHNEFISRPVPFFGEEEGAK